MLNDPLYEIDWSGFEEDVLWEHYEKYLKSHDWSYEYSDCHKYWASGSRERAETYKLKTYLGKIDKKKADEMFFKASPFYNDDGTTRKK